MNTSEIVEGILSGNRRLLARAITLVEDGHPAAREIIRQIYSRTGRAHVVGITGFPGTGKSTIVSKLVEEFRRRNKSVGIIAIDPSSPFTGGALLGDRVRLEGADVNKTLWTDEKVFFRSMGSRGGVGGVAKKTGEVVRLLDAAGYEIIFVETVGAGQSEIGIMEIADTVVLVLMPETGDDIQVNKAGILEIGDIFVINKADLDGAESVERWLKQTLSPDSSLSLESVNAVWKRPVIKTVATKGIGIEELAEAICEHFDFLKSNGLLEKRKAEKAKMVAVELAMEKIRAEILRKYRDLLSSGADPYAVAEAIVKDLIKT